MALLVRDIKIPVEETKQEGYLIRAVAQKLDVDPDVITSLEVKKKSLDARNKRRIHYNFQLFVETPLQETLAERYAAFCERTQGKRVKDPLEDIALENVKLRHKPVIIGSGPAGIFAALVFARAKVPCIVIERGEPVEQRLKTVGRLLRKGEFTPNSNYCYGEGGAGTFSDGKLTCGRNHPLIQYLFHEWVHFGAPKSILYDAHPHIGTDNLMRVSKNMRSYLEAQGTEFIFGRSFVGIEPGNSQRRQTVVLDDGAKIDTDHLLLAFGHSARETYEMLHEKGVGLEQKPFAIGARIEHPQDVIDQIQFGSCEILPAAEYKLASQVQNRGIWTFCMCPGGHLLPTSAQPGHLAINGMSYYARNSGFANAAVVVNVRREDFDRGHVLDGIRFQKAIEQKAFEIGGGNYHSPAQRLVDFIGSKDSHGELRSTYKPGVTNARIDRLLPKFVGESLQAAMTQYNQKMRGYITDRALVVGVETKTSAPVVIKRDKSFQSVTHAGLYPTGEGAGFAGGIVSAALDGLRVAQGIVKQAAE